MNKILTKLLFRMVIILEINLIREDKLKVLLTPFDMMKYELTCEKLDYDNTETRKAIWSILDFAKHETGFDAAIGKIRIEVYPEKNGGCAIYITKLNKSDFPSSDEMNESNGKTPAVPKEIPAVYKFEDSEALTDVCRFLTHRGYTADSAAYFELLPEGKTRFFLQISESSKSQTSKKAKYLRENLFIGEFGVKLECDEALFYLREHCIPLCEKNAVQTLSSLSK